MQQATYILEIISLSVVTLAAMAVFLRTILERRKTGPKMLDRGAHAADHLEELLVRDTGSLIESLRKEATEIIDDVEIKINYAREISHELGSRAAELSELLDRVDQVLHQEGSDQGQPIPDTTPDASEPSGGKVIRLDSRRLATEVPSEGRSTDQILCDPAVPNGAPGQAATQSVSERKQGDHSAIYERIRGLAEKGRRPEEIAREVGIGVGEVQLVLGLSNPCCRTHSF